jgi:hypothetical protein
MRPRRSSWCLARMPRPWRRRSHRPQRCTSRPRPGGSLVRMNPRRPQTRSSSLPSHGMRPHRSWSRSGRSPRLQRHHSHCRRRRSPRRSRSPCRPRRSPPPRQTRSWWPLWHRTHRFRSSLLLAQRLRPLRHRSPRLARRSSRRCPRGSRTRRSPRPRLRRSLSSPSHRRRPRRSSSPWGRTPHPSRHRSRCPCRRNRRLRQWQRLRRRSPPQRPRRSWWPRSHRTHPRRSSSPSGSTPRPRRRRSRCRCCRSRRQSRTRVPASHESPTTPATQVVAPVDAHTPVPQVVASSRSPRRWYRRSRCQRRRSPSRPRRARFAAIGHDARHAGGLASCGARPQPQEVGRTHEGLVGGAVAVVVGGVAVASPPVGSPASQVSPMTPAVQVVLPVAAHTPTPHVVGSLTKDSSVEPSQSLSVASQSASPPVGRRPCRCRR